MQTLLLTLELCTPILVPGISSGEANSRITLPYIPGAALRGAVIARYANTPKDLAAEKAARRLFFSGEVRYLNAYPEAENGSGQRALPVPASWRIEKDEDLDRAQAADFALLPSPTKDMPVRRTFCAAQDDGAYLVFDPVEKLAIHIGSQARGAVEKIDSTVFQYQALERGQRFIAAIQSKDASLLGKLQTLLAGQTIFIGRSASAGYGQIEVVKAEVAGEAKWQECESGEIELTILTLLSDAILRDKWGQPTLDLDDYLSRRLKKMVKRKAAFIQPAVAGGFNRKWQLPLPQFPALGMGSVFVYDPQALSANDLQSLAEDGIGERRVDGYGRIVVNWQVTEQIRLLIPGSPTTQPAPSILAPASQKLAALMARRLLRQKLELRLEDLRTQYQLNGRITNHQLARLRGLLRQQIYALEGETKPGDAIQVVQKFFEELKRQSAEQWENTRLARTGSKSSGERLKLWILERLSKTDGLEMLKMNNRELFPKIAGQQAALDERLRAESTLRVIDIVIDQGMKANRPKGGV